MATNRLIEIRLVAGVGSVEYYGTPAVNEERLCPGQSLRGNIPYSHLLGHREAPQ